MNHKNRMVAMHKRCCPINGSGFKKHVMVGKGIKLSAPAQSVSVPVQSPQVSDSLDRLKFGKKKSNIHLSF